MRQTVAALRWIVGILTAENIPYEIDGGLAAHAYGAERELADIDINIAEKDFARVLPLVKEYLRFGPAHFEDEHWRCYMMTLKVDGQNIDLCAIETMHYFDAVSSEWNRLPSDLSKATWLEYEGMRLPFISEAELMAYKDVLGRGVDRKDVAGMQINTRPEPEQQST